MTNLLCYDLEIIKAIPPKDAGDRNPSIEYCGGWADFDGMGISVIGCCWIQIDGGGRVSLIDPMALIADKYGLAKFASMVSYADGIVGFNSCRFDDQLMGANGVPVSTTYDLLEEVRISSYGSADYRDCPKGNSYSLGKIAAANGLAKTGDGANAAIQWQQGLHDEVIEYCKNDVAITAKLFRLGLTGTLKDPNTGQLLQLAEVS
jgi:DEAD/DEAH box helicase domain-containing protein